MKKNSPVLFGGQMLLKAEIDTLIEERYQATQTEFKRLGDEWEKENSKMIATVICPNDKTQWEVNLDAPTTCPTCEKTCTCVTNPQCPNHGDTAAIYRCSHDSECRVAASHEHLDVIRMTPGS